jgi:hypothetical protein
LIAAHAALKRARSRLETEAAAAKINLAESIAENQAILEVNLDSCLLQQSVEILVRSDCMSEAVFETLVQNTTPIFLYGITESQLNEEELLFVAKFREAHPNDAVFFVHMTEDATSSTRVARVRSHTNRRCQTAKGPKKHVKSGDSAFKIFCQLHSLNFLDMKPACEHMGGRRERPRSYTVLSNGENVRRDG